MPFSSDILKPPSLKPPPPIHNGRQQVAVQAQACEHPWKWGRAAQCSHSNQLVWLPHVEHPGVCDAGTSEELGSNGCSACPSDPWFGIVQKVFSEKVSAITRVRQKCVRNVSKMRHKRAKMGLVLLGKEERSRMRQI